MAYVIVIQQSIDHEGNSRDLDVPYKVHAEIYPTLALAIAAMTKHYGIYFMTHYFDSNTKQLGITSPGGAHFIATICETL